MKKARTILITAIMMSILSLCEAVSAEWSEPVPLDEVNTPYTDKEPFLSFDGLTLYFSRLDTDTFYYTRMYQATRAVPYGPFTSVEEISTLNYSEGHVTSAWVSPDNLRMYYVRTEPGNRWRLKMSVRASADDSWPPGANISELNTLGDLASPRLTPDELTIFFLGNGVPGNLSQYNIWTATRTDRNSPFGDIKNVTEINTTGGESPHFVTADGLTLYFGSSRNGEPQYFRASRDSVDSPFENIEHLGWFEAPGRTLSKLHLTPDGKTCYLSMNIDGQPQNVYVAYLEEDAGLVAHWKFDEGSGAIAYDSAGTNDGAVHGATWVDGVLDGALDFDGVDDYVALPDNSPVWLPENDFTLSVWAYFDRDPDPSLGETLLDLNFADSANPSNELGYVVSRAGSTYSGQVAFGLTTVTATDEDLHSNGLLLGGRWYHVVAVRDGTTQAIYIDGVLDNSRICSGDPIKFVGGYDDDRVSIGRCTTTNSPNGIFHFNGKMDDVRIYDRALSAGEVEALYCEVVPPVVGEVYHVDGVNGNDGWDGLSAETAFATIQKGIDTAKDSDTVLVWPGDYSERISFEGKAITVKSADYPAVIETPWQDAVSFAAGEGPGSVLSNFVIRQSATAIACNNESSPTLTNLTIVENNFGIAAYEASAPDISNCILWSNQYGDLYGCDAEYSLVEEQATAEPPTDGLVSHWPFDEGTGSTAYDSAGSNDGVVFGATWVDGVLDGALDFDGVDDYVALPDNSPVWLPENDFTLSVWAYFDRDPDPSLGETLLGLNFADSANPSNELGYVVSRAGSTYSGQVAFALTTVTATDEDLHSNGLLLGGRWYHVVAVRDGTTQAIYIDGVLDNSRICSGDPIKFVGGYDDDRVSIGRCTTTNSPNGIFHFNGKMDDVRIYNRALTAEEVAGLYGAQTLAGPLFADSANGDYHLLSEKGRFVPGYGLWSFDDETSPGVDGGDPSDDPSGERMPNGGRINMGAYGGTPYASMSEWPLAYDGNRDGKMDFKDLAGFCDEWLTTLPWAN